jgi:hypothetical protein
VVSSDASSDFGQSVFFTATVTPQPGGGVPAGSVQFKVDGANFGSAVTLSGGSAVSPSTFLLAPGSHEIRATYNPAPGFEGSEGTTTQTVGLAPTTTVAGTSPNASVFGQSVTITATVSSALGPVNSGTVTFYDGGGSCGAGTPLGSDQVSSGSASLSTSSLAVLQLSHQIWACYGGSAGTFAGSGDDVAHQVSKASTSVEVQTSGSSPLGDPVAVQVTVTALSPGAGTPGGTVTVSGTGAAGDCEITLANGTGSCNLDFPIDGTKTITATYQGDDSFGSSSGNTNHNVAPQS